MSLEVIYNAFKVILTFSLVNILPNKEMVPERYLNQIYHVNSLYVYLYSLLSNYLSYISS